LSVAFGVIYTPFIPGGSELENGIEYAKARLPSCIRVFDASTDALTVLDTMGEVRVYYIVGASKRVAPGRYTRVELRSTMDYGSAYDIVEEIRASMEGSLDPLDLAKAMAAFLSAQGKDVKIIVYACGSGGCREALEEAVREVLESTKCTEA